MHMYITMNNCTTLLFDYCFVSLKQCGESQCLIVQWTWKRIAHNIEIFSEVVGFTISCCSVVSRNTPIS